ncbi:MAG: circularly permuted type 2 ATP-grasp protein [Propionibacteriaceae bacterium]|nr:circularly permuted type 2 ATP-grasp protein [Propionibacteriaceae bacterium]
MSRYLAAGEQPSLVEDEPVRFDEFAAPDGTARPSWAPLVDGLAELAGTDLLHSQREVARLLEDEGVTYTPSPLSAVSIADQDGHHTDGVLANAKPWKLDPLPLIVGEREWADLEVGVVQRGELLAAIMADLYGAQRLLSERQLPAAAVFDHDEFLRPLVGIESLSSQPLFMLAVDLGRDAGGQWKVMSDRTQAPSGAGFAMQNRRVVSRVLPEVYHDVHLHRLTPFFHAMRMALVDAAPRGVEDPRVVVMSPGTHSETAFDQAFLASLLGFPLLEGSDLTVRDGRVWMRALGKLEPVDVILRRVDSTWSDPLELRAGSRLGVAGLVTAVRQGTVSVANNLGSGILENPALLPFLPELSQRLLGEPLRLPSVDTWWCGDEASLSHVLAHLDSLVIRPISRGAGRSVLGSALTADQRAGLSARVRQAPHRYVGQEVLTLSSAPTSEQDRLVRRNVVLRSFAVRHANSYTPMLGGLARVNDGSRNGNHALVTPPEGGVAKDVWVVSSDPIAAAPVPQPRRGIDIQAESVPLRAASSSAAMVPRVLNDLFWFGRYAERAEDLLRLVVATRTVAIETDGDVTHGRALDVLLQAITHVSATYPGFVAEGCPIMPELRSMMLDRRRSGTVAQSLAASAMAAQGVRDQLSADVWMVFAEVDRSLAALAVMSKDQGLQLAETSERVLAGLLALAGIVSENMVRDPGWYLLDSGRGLERALQVVSLLRVTLCQERAPEFDRAVVEAVMTSAESIVTFRRRYRERAGTDAVVELLVVDPHNPRSVAYQLARIATDLRSLPNATSTARPVRLLQDLVETITAADLAALVQPRHGHRPALEEFLAGLHGQLGALSEAIREQYLQPPPTPQPLWRSSSSKDALS